MSSEVATRQNGSAPARPMLVVEDSSQISHLMDTARFEHLQRIARMLGNSALTPKHLHGSTPEETLANCFRVVNQAIRWQFDPFAVADETYVVSGKLGYQGKLVAAVIHTRAGLEGRLTCSFEGTGDKRKITITGKFRHESDPRIITLEVGQAKTQNKLWTVDPDQKLWYSGVIKWARRHCPEVIMGVLTEDDLERMQADVAEKPVASVLAKFTQDASQPQAKIEALIEPKPEPKPTEPTAKTSEPDTTNYLTEEDVQDLWNDLHTASTPLEFESAKEAVQRQRTKMKRSELSRLDAKIAEMAKTIK